MPRSFYNFLRYHNVCPEFDEQLVKALKICEIAEEELPKVHATGLALPGDFNKSASALFGGAHAGLYVGDKSWAEDMKKEGMYIDQTGIRDEEAKIKFGAGLAIMGSDEQAANLDSLHLKTLDIISATLEVVDIKLPTEDVKALYKAQSKISQHKIGGQLQPLGKLICRTWHADDCDEWDLPKDRCPDGRPQQVGTERSFEFWIEQHILEDCLVGLKIDGKILILEGGMTILDEVHETMCSFFIWLPNELYMANKPRTVVWLAKGLAEDIDEPIAAIGGDYEEDHKEGEGGSQGQDYGWDAAIGHGQGEEEGGHQGEKKNDGDGDFSDDDYA